MKNETGKILVVDDERTNRTLLASRLRREGHEIAECASGEEAIEAIQGDTFDLVMLDVVMPGLSGMEVLKHIRAEATPAELPVIMVTARDTSEDVVEALEEGANDYVTKPLDFPVVLSRVQVQIRLRRLSELKDEFLRIASHDLKNPITSVRSFASFLQQMLKPGSPVDEQAITCAERIYNASRTMQKIVEDFLDFQALEDGRMQLVIQPNDLNAIVHTVVDTNAEYAASKSIEALLELAEDLPELQFDRDRLLQVVQNFVSNAIKFSPADTSFTVTTRAHENGVLLEVTDRGPGLTKDDLAKTFVKYARLSNKPTGGEKSSGLGLAICKQLVEAHGGEIGVHSTPGQGATFWFRLPVAS